MSQQEARWVPGLADFLGLAAGLGLARLALDRPPDPADYQRLDGDGLRAVMVVELFQMVWSEEAFGNRRE